MPFFCFYIGLFKQIVINCLILFENIKLISLLRGRIRSSTIAFTYRLRFFFNETAGGIPRRTPVSGLIDG